MQETKNELARNKTQKKANLCDHNSIKYILDESVSKVVTSKGYPEDVRISNARLFIGMTIIFVALFAQFYKKKFPENWNFLIVCITLYIFFQGILQLLVYLKGKNAILLTHPPPGSLSRTGLIVTSKLSRFSVMYTLDIRRRADPEPKSANPPVDFTINVTRWFSKDGVLVERLFCKEVEGLVNDCAKQTKMSKKYSSNYSKLKS